MGNEAKRLATADLTTGAKVIEEQITGPLTTAQRQSPNIQRIDFR